MALFLGPCFSDTKSSLTKVSKAMGGWRASGPHCSCHHNVWFFSDLRPKMFIRDSWGRIYTCCCKPTTFKLGLQYGVAFSLDFNMESFLPQSKLSCGVSFTRTWKTHQAEQIYRISCLGGFFFNNYTLFGMLLTSFSFVHCLKNSEGLGYI